MEICVHTIWPMDISLVSTIMDLQCIGRKPYLESFYTEYGYAYLGDDIHIFCLMISCSFQWVLLFQIPSLLFSSKYFGHQFLFQPHKLGGICYTLICHIFGCHMWVLQLSHSVATFVVIAIISLKSFIFCIDKCHIHLRYSHHQKKVILSTLKYRTKCHHSPPWRKFLIMFPKVIGRKLILLSSKPLSKPLCQRPFRTSLLLVPYAGRDEILIITPYTTMGEW